MKQVFICGLDGYRDEIVTKISDGVIIKGYIDIDENNKRKLFDYYRVYSICPEIVTPDARYVIAYNEEDKINLVSKALLNLGIRKKNIIVYKTYRDCKAINTIKRFEKTQPDCDVLILGMSHAKSDIIPSIVSDYTFSFAAPSFDIFCHQMIMKQLQSKYSEKVKNVKKIVIELPYYAFNYDLSKFGSFAITKFDYFLQFGTFHNFDNKEIIKGFFEFREIFKNENDANYIVESSINPSNKGVKGKIYHLIDMIKVILNKDKVWANIYKDTIEENKKLFRYLLDLCNTTCPYAEIYVLICPFNPLFIKTHKNVISKQKEIFYSCVKGSCVQIIDMFECVKKSNLFLDHCHLNNLGAKLWSKVLKDRIGIERERK